jgi:hypothetical protein
MSDVKISESARVAQQELDEHAKRLGSKRNGRPCGIHVQLAINEATKPLVELCESWEKVASNSNWNGHIRDAYGNCAKELRQALAQGQNAELSNHEI